MTEEFPSEWGERRRRREEERLRLEQADATHEATTPPSRRELRRRESTDSTPVAPPSTPAGGLGPSRPVSSVRHEAPAAPARPAAAPEAPRETAPRVARRSAHHTAPAAPEGGRGVTWSTTAGRTDVPTTQTLRADIPVGEPAGTQARRAASAPKAPTRRQLREPTGEASQVGIAPPPVTGGVRRLGPDGRLSPVEPTAPVDLPSPAERSAALRAQAERARTEREQVAQERVRAAQQRAARERVERERQEKSRREHTSASAVESRPSDAARAEAARAEAARVEAERVEAERVEAERVEAERAAQAVQVGSDRAARGEAEDRDQDDAERVARERGASAARMVTRGQQERIAPSDPTAPGSTGPAREVAAPIAVVVPGTASGPVPDEAEPEAGRGRIARLRAERVAEETAARERVLAAERVGKTAKAQDAEIASPDVALADRSPSVDRFGAAALEAPVVPLWPALTGETITVSAESTRPVRRTRRGFGDEEELAALDAHSDEDEKPDEAETAHSHPYSWIHWVALVLVAFVLGVIIMMVINRDAASGTSNASQVAAVVVTVPGTV